jgi:hypothetical protein
MKCVNFRKGKNDGACHQRVNTYMQKVAQKHSKCINMHQTMLKVTSACVFANLWRELPPVHTTSPPSKQQWILTFKEESNRQYAFQSQNKASIHVQRHHFNIPTRFKPQNVAQCERLTSKRLTIGSDPKCSDFTSQFHVTETHFELQTSFETLSNVVEKDKLTMASQWRLCSFHVRGFRDWHKSSFFGTSPPITHEIWCTQKS